jgi:hypothetical protein
VSGYSILLGLAVASFVSGLARARYRFAPIVAGALIVGGYLAIAATLSILTARCWECHPNDNQSFENGGQFLRFALAFGGAIGFFDLVLIWIGTRVSRRVWKKRA